MSFDQRQFLLNKLKELKHKKCSYQTKIALLQSFAQSLHSAVNLTQTQQPLMTYSRLKIDRQSTSHSFFSEGPSNIQFEDMQQRIMEKRVVKFQINQQIQGLEDDLFQIEKVVETKRNFNDELRLKIEKRMSKISDNADQQRKKTKSTYIMNKSIGAVSGIFKNLLK